MGVSVAVGAALAVSVGWVGVTFLSGQQELYLAFSIEPSASFYVPPIMWIVVGIATFLLVLAAGLRLDPMLGWTILSVLIGGSAMVVGYFLYEGVVLQLGFVSASVEVPVNVGQVLVGLLVSIPAVRSMRRVARGNQVMSGSQAAAR